MNEVKNWNNCTQAMIGYKIDQSLILNKSLPVNSDL